MPSLSTVRLKRDEAFKFKKTIHTKSSSPSPPSFLDITPALQQYLQFIVSFTLIVYSMHAFSSIIAKQIPSPHRKCSFSNTFST